MFRFNSEPSCKASVIIPARNSEKFIGKAIESALNQKIEGIEILVINNDSTDSTAEIALSYPHVRVFSQKNLGIPLARNKGIVESSGKFISFLDSDDIWPRDRLKNQLKIFDANPDIEIVDGPRRNILDPGIKRPPWLDEHTFSEKGVITLSITTALVKREVFNKVGLFDKDFEPHDDVEWYIRARDYGINIKNIAEVLLFRRIHENNISYDRTDDYKCLCRILSRSIKRRRQL